MFGNTDNMFSILLGIFGLAVGIAFAAILGLAGHGWISLLAVPATPLAMIAGVKLWLGPDA